MPVKHLVLLPGLDGTGRLFKRFLGIASATFQCTVVSYPPDVIIEYQNLLPFVEAALPESDSYAVVAESFSGRLALGLAAKGPRGLKAVVLVASFISSPMPRFLRMCVSTPLLRLLMRDCLIKQYLVGRDSSVLTDVMEVMGSVKDDVIAARIKQVLDLKPDMAFDAIKIPLFYLGGYNDRLVGARGLAQVKNHLNEVRASFIDGPHLLMQVKPDAAFDKIKRFLGEGGR